MKPIEFLLLAILFAVLNLSMSSPFLKIGAIALGIAGAWASYRCFMRDLHIGNVP